MRSLPSVQSEEPSTNKWLYNLCRVFYSSTQLDFSSFLLCSGRYNTPAFPLPFHSETPNPRGAAPTGVATTVGTSRPFLSSKEVGGSRLFMVAAGEPDRLPAETAGEKLRLAEGEAMERLAEGDVTE